MRFVCGDVRVQIGAFVRFVQLADSYLPQSPRGASAAIRSKTHRAVVASFQKRNRNPTVGAMLLRWRKPEAKPPFTCVNMIPE
jgi:hypothetical protein